MEKNKEPTDESMEFSGGHFDFRPFKIKANEALTIHGDWNWADTNYSPDWSIYAWGDKGSLSLTHLKGLASDKMPLLARPGATAAQTDATKKPDATKTTVDPKPKDSGNKTEDKTAGE